MPPESRAYISKITDLKEDVSKSLDFIEWEKNSSKDNTVFIKSIFPYPYHKKGINITFRDLSEILTILKNQIDSIIVGESNSGQRIFA